MQMIPNRKIHNSLAFSSASAQLARSAHVSRPEKQLLNRELSLVEFFRHVLEQAQDQQTPLLERLRFITIFANIVDEFFMIRISGLKEEIDEGWFQPSADGMSADEQLRAIRQKLRPMIAEQVRCLKEDLLPELAAERIEVLPYHSLSETERRDLDHYFARNVFPVLTPLAVDPAHPFPYISGLSLNLGVMVEPHNHFEHQAGNRLEAHFVRLKVPPVLPGLVRVGQVGSKFIFLSDLIAANLGALFPGMSVAAAHAFRVTRDADIEVRDEEADDLLRALQTELRKRRFGAPVRLEVAATMPKEMVEYLTSSLGVDDDDVYWIDGPLNTVDLAPLCDL